MRFFIQLLVVFFLTLTCGHVKKAEATGWNMTLNEKVKLDGLGVGQVAPEIAMPNPEGKIMKLSALRGKYVLVDFWDTACGICRDEKPIMAKAYKRFHSKGFEVYSVCLDDNREDWLDAIKEDGAIGTQVSDLNNWANNKAAKDYDAFGLPYSILLDKNGVIIAKALYDFMLEEKLEELLGK